MVTPTVCIYTRVCVFLSKIHPGWFSHSIRTNYNHRRKSENTNQINWAPNFKACSFVSFPHLALFFSLSFLSSLLFVCSHWFLHFLPPPPGKSCKRKVNGPGLTCKTAAVCPSLSSVEAKKYAPNTVKPVKVRNHKTLLICARIFSKKSKNCTSARTEASYRCFLLSGAWCYGYPLRCGCGNEEWEERERTDIRSERVSPNELASEIEIKRPTRVLHDREREGMIYVNTHSLWVRTRAQTSTSWHLFSFSFFISFSFTFFLSFSFFLPFVCVCVCCPGGGVATETERGRRI